MSTSTTHNTTTNNAGFPPAPGETLQKTNCKGVIATAEQNRADWWQIIDLLDRQRALCVAGLQRKRAADSLATFSDSERALIKTAIGVHVARMEMIAKCFELSNTGIDGFVH